MAAMSFTSVAQESSINQQFGKDASFTLPQLIGSMSISPSGRDVVLASKEGLRIIDLDSPYSPPRFLPHRTPWEVADVQWSPFADRDYWIISTSNQKALVWNVNAFGWRNSIEHVLHGHTRAITDINFSAHHPDKLATCAVDSFVHCWDLRCASPLVNSFSDWFAGATQVKWSRQDEHVIASSHDRSLHIWDVRYGARPARTIVAHDTKIYGIDWNRFEPNKIVTCSLDKTIKFWDIQKEESIPDRVIKTDFPVWRARHTPFGWGLMVMPQRGSGDLHLYDRRTVNSSSEIDSPKPVHVFPGHKGQVKEFLWRAMGTVKDGIDHRDFQLVSWGTDHELRLHEVPADTFGKIGYQKGVSKPQRLRFTRKGAKYRTFRDEPSETDIIAGAFSRTDSLPASNQFLRVRGRLSTNMGMNRVPLTQFKGWLQTGRLGRRTDMHGRGAGRPDTDPFSWMKNVRIGAAWDNDSLAEELTAVGDKYKRIDFETINITQRRATASLQSPWGEDKNIPIYMRLDFKFPKLYPKEAQAIVHVQRTNSIASELQKQLSANISKITEAYQKYGRGCVEGVFRYVLQEQPLDDILATVDNDPLFMGTGNADDVDDASDSDDEQIRPNSRTPIESTPLAKGSAAMWAENGKLVCFFERREKEPSTPLNTLGIGRLDEPEPKRLFGGFGRFQIDSPSRKMRDKPGTTGGDSDSDSGVSDRSSLFSSSTSSSDSSIGLGVDSTNAFWQKPKGFPIHPYKSAEGSQKSTIQDNIKAEGTSKGTVVSIYDLSYIFPTQEAIAPLYKILGDVVAVAQHNLVVAENHSLRAAASTWRLVHNLFSSPTPTNANDKLLKFTQSFELPSYNSYGHNRTSSESSPWLNRLAVVQIFPSLLQFHEQSSDIQTLGLLAGVFLQTQITKLKDLSNPAAFHKQEFYKDNRVNYEKLPSKYQLVQHRHNDQVGPMDDSLVPEPLSHSQSPNERVNDNSDSSRHFALPTLSSHRTASTTASSRAPSVKIHNSSGPGTAINSTVVSLAGSPENYRMSSRKSESAINYPMATASLQALTKSRPPSPTGSSLRRFMPVYDSARSSGMSPDSDISRFSRAATKSSLNLVNLQASSSESQNYESYRHHPRSALKNGNKDDSRKRKTKRRLKTNFVSPQVPAREGITMPDDEYLMFCRKCVSYAAQYATQLEAWRLWMQFAEFNKLCAEVMSLLGKIESGDSQDHTATAEESCLSFRWCCPTCGAYMAPIEKNGLAIGWQCVTADCASKTLKVSKKQRCSICEIVIQGLCAPCTQCGHVTCWDCAEEWFGRANGRTSVGSNSSVSGAKERMSNDSTCPAGCGCHCSQLREIFVPYPIVEDDATEVEKTITPTTPRSEGYQEHTTNVSTFGEHRARRGQSIGTMDPSANTAMNALLALNLASRHRSTSGTTRPSQPTNHHNSMSQASSGRFGDTDVVDELLPWAHDRNATLARGSGPGLSRGLSAKGSSSTIRKLDGNS